MKKIKQKKKLGQHFLRDKKTVAQIVALVNEGKTDFILEIGAGNGVLTEKLLELDKLVLAVEIDVNWANRLQEKFGKKKNFQLITGDILKLNLKEILAKYKKICWVGNLPYQISTPLFFLLLQNQFLYEYVVFMFQKEFAERIIGDKKKSAKNYGSLAVLSDLFFSLEEIFTVPNKYFYPFPKVDSTVLKMRKKNFAMKNKEDFFAFLRCFFQQPRKTLLNNLKQPCPNILEVLKNNSIDHYANLRPAELSTQEILALFHLLEKIKK